VADEVPRLEGGADGLRATYDASVSDLASLRARGADRDAPAFPAGGIPWYLALFGRDSLLASYAAVHVQPSLAAGALTALAARQATEWDDFRDAEPGKILHELRHGTRVALGEDPHGPYYGTQLERDATALKERFNRDFWHAERGHFVLALDRDKRQVDALTSNIGHLLWSGIADADKAARTAEALLSEALFTGWGIRTLSTDDRAYNPLAYHLGTVWPHDTAIAAEGLRRYGFRREAATVAGALLDAVAALEHRAPEVFGGFTRDEAGIPVRYPGALTPQAWAAAAPLLALRTLLGLDVADGRLSSDPLDSGRLQDVRLRRVRCRGARYDVRG
jgi:glycogen debranching enzyme